MTHDFLLPLIKAALAEDIGSGDLTSQLLIPVDSKASMQFVAREPMVICGVDVPSLVYSFLRHPDESRNDVIVKTYLTDGALAGQGDVIATASGNARALLTGERTALNIMQRMSGVATLTRQYVDAIAGTKAVILDTRKTMPGMRLADKYAVKMGGGQNHRMGLYDAVLVKDNHLAISDKRLAMSDLMSGIHEKLLLIPHLSSLIPIIIECDTLEQVKEALTAKTDRILLDNMSLENLRAAVKMADGKIPLEASGGVNLQTVRSIAETGVDFISVGAITHSAKAVDIGLDILS